MCFSFCLATNILLGCRLTSWSRLIGQLKWAYFPNLSASVGLLSKVKFTGRRTASWNEIKHLKFNELFQIFSKFQIAPSLRRTNLIIFRVILCSHTSKLWRKWRAIVSDSKCRIKIFAVIAKYFQTLLPNDVVLIVLLNEVTGNDCLLIIVQQRSAL